MGAGSGGRQAKDEQKNISAKDHDAKAKIDAARLSGKDKKAGDTKRRLDSRLKQTRKTLSALGQAAKRKEGVSFSASEGPAHIIHLPAGRIEAGGYELTYPDIHIQRNTRIAVCGRNGTGKSLLLQRICETFCAKYSKDQLFYLPQEISAGQEQELLNQAASLNSKEKGDMLSAMYRLGSETEAVLSLHGQGGILSPGELRKLAIALALSSPVRMMILDEPTNHMDIISITALESVLQDIPADRENGIAVVAVSHDHDFLQKAVPKGNGSSENRHGIYFFIQRNGNAGSVVYS